MASVEPNLPVDRVTVWRGDITDPPAELAVDAIVDAANESLHGGSGVDGAIHRAAGPRLLEHNRTLGGCPTGSAKLAPSFDLSDRGVAHIVLTVGPVWHAGEHGEVQSLGNTHEDVLLANCYVQSLRLAEQAGARCVAFPAISTGVYGFPKDRAAKIALGHVLGHLGQHSLPERVVFCCFSEDDADLYRTLIDTRGKWLTSRRRVPPL
ncbi:MAG: macro domain-containing protein [Planctomycetota bacterium]